MEYSAALYMRLSKDDGKRDFGSIGSQKEILRRFAAEKGFSVFGEYIDATDIIGLKQNPTNGRRFSPIFSFIGHFSIQFEENATSKAKEEN